MTRTEKYDIVIAGAGPAGAAFAYFVSKLGLRVALVDMRRWDDLWGKPCGDAISHHTFTDIGLEPPRGDEVRQHVNGILIYSPDEKTVFKVDGKGYIIDRTKFGQRLVKGAADNGVEVMLETRILGPIVEDGRVAGVKARTRGGELLELKARLVVEATGASRAIKSRLPGDWPVAEGLEPYDMNVAYRERRELDYEIENPDYIRIYLNQSIAPGGYWWFFPEGRHEVNAGLGVQAGKGYPNPRDIFYETLVRRPELKPTTRILNAAGAPLPTRRPANTMVGPGVIAIGDAGYTVNPVHGGGMSYSMKAARYAANAVEKAVETGDWSEKTLWSLNVEYMENVGAKQAALDIFRIFLQQLSDEELSYGMAKRLIREQDTYETSASGQLRISAWDKIVRIIMGLGKPTLLLKLKTVADYMKKVRQLYLEYPASPEDLPRWTARVSSLYSSYFKTLGIEHP